MQELSKQYTDLQYFDPERYGSIYPDKEVYKRKLQAEVEGLVVVREKPKTCDMAETQVPGRLGKKVAGVHDIRLLEKLENARKFTSPADEILARGV